MGEPTSILAREVASVPDVIDRQDRLLAGSVRELSARLRLAPPRVVVTCARGSSAHAGTFAKHLLELHLGLPVAAAAPSIASIYRRRLELDGQLVLAISQSGASDDLIAFVREARDSGALTVAVTNDADAQLAAACTYVLSIGAGAELSVAATKTFVATVSALVRLTSAWAQDQTLAAALSRLPQRLAAATALDWCGPLEALAGAEGLAAIGRGPTLAIAREAALKLKEICSMPAEAFSGAEFLHGPVALVSSRYPVLMLMPTDAAYAGMQSLKNRLERKSAQVWSTQAGPSAVGCLPALASDRPETDAICLVQSFYSMLPKLAAMRGLDADRPPHLTKITRTE
jgi:glutamine---fructose-6-phosphate transaminase (isomerizing)